MFKVRTFLAVYLSFLNLFLPQSWLDLLLIHILLMGFCPTRSYPFF